MGLFIYAVLFLLTVGFALGVLLTRNAAKSALCLISVMLCIAANYLLMRQEFVAFIQIVVYAGAIMVLFLFVIMLLNLREPERSPWYLRGTRFWAGAAGVTFFFVLAVAITVFSGSVAPPAALATEAAIAERGTPEVTLLATLMMTRYIVPFFLTSVLLLVAVIGAIVMARRRDEDGIELHVDEEAA